MRNLFVGSFILLFFSACSPGTFTDSRDGREYGTTKIGEQVWMAENLSFDTAGSWCFEDDPVNCEVYGRLYTWESAKTGCPAGWHLPSDAEWNQLINYLGAEAGKKLKSTSGWEEEGNGTDKSGFSALPGGSRNHFGHYTSLGKYTYWWGATEADAEGAWYRSLNYAKNDVARFSGKKKAAFYVRCIKD
jgi:uncharacterized protein (TIGR02145 family)